MTIACGLPIILSNEIQVKERVDGNGLLYAENNCEDLVAKLEELIDLDKRKQLGECGVKKINKCYSWINIAQEVNNDFEVALRKATRIF